jgi:hypothetical protein
MSVEEGMFRTELTCGRRLGPCRALGGDGETVLTEIVVKDVTPKERE